MGGRLRALVAIYHLPFTIYHLPFTIYRYFALRANGADGFSAIACFAPMAPTYFLPFCQL
jgi:hypothetical protein